MGESIRKIKMFPYYDYPAVERYLNDMALQGWQLEKINLGWKFRKTEPQALHYEVVYGRWEDQLPREREKQCERITQGEWQKVTDWLGAEIYVSAQENPCSIGIDEAERLESLHRYKGGNMRFGNMLLFILVCAMLAADVKEAADNPVKILSMASNLAMMAVWSALAITGLWEWFEYGRWRKEQKTAVQQERTMDSSGYHKSYLSRQCFLYASLLLVVMAYWFDGGWKLVAAVLFLGSILVGSYGIVRWIMKKLHFSTGSQRVVGSITIGLVMFLLLFGLGESNDFRNAIRAWVFPEKEMYQLVTVGTEQYKVYDDHLLITIEDLGISTEATRYTKEVTEQESVLLKRTLAQQAAIPLSYKLSDDMAKPEFSYEIVDVKAGFLYDACKASVENRLISHSVQGILYNSVFQNFIDSNAPSHYAGQYVLLDAISDKTVTIYQLTNGKQENAYGYLFLWDNRIAAVCMSWEATPEQLAIMIDAMKIHPLVPQ